MHNVTVKMDAPPYGGFESLFFYQGSAASFKLSQRRAPYLNVGHLKLPKISRGIKWHYSPILTLKE
jgi:hypothetical protein